MAGELDFSRQPELDPAAVRDQAVAAQKAWFENVATKKGGLGLFSLDTPGAIDFYTENDPPYPRVADLWPESIFPFGRRGDFWPRLIQPI